MSDTQEERQRKLLLREYELHQGAIDKFDGQRLQVRNWSVVVVGASLAVAFQQDSVAIAFLAVAGAVAFALNEALHAAIIKKIIDRNCKLEPLFAPDTSSEQLLAYHFGVSIAYAGSTTIRQAARLLFEQGRLHMSFFYAALFTGSLACALLLGLR